MFSFVFHERKLGLFLFLFFSSLFSFFFCLEWRCIAHWAAWLFIWALELSTLTRTISLTAKLFGIYFWMWKRSFWLQKIPTSKYWKGIQAFRLAKCVGGLIDLISSFPLSILSCQGELSEKPRSLALCKQVTSAKKESKNKANEPRVDCKCACNLTWQHKDRTLFRGHF